MMLLVGGMRMREPAELFYIPANGGPAAGDKDSNVLARPKADARRRGSTIVRRSNDDVMVTAPSTIPNSKLRAKNIT